MVTFPDAVKTYLRKYGDFSGRVTRAEYWWWVLAMEDYEEYHDDDDGALRSAGRPPRRKANCKTSGVMPWPSSITAILRTTDTD